VRYLGFESMAPRWLGRRILDPIAALAVAAEGNAPTTGQPTPLPVAGSAQSSSGWKRSATLTLVV
jgi:hypothetical protein